MSQRPTLESRAPDDVHTLRRQVHAWPVSEVQQAVLDAIADPGRPGQSEALAALVASWLTEEDGAEPPPLNATCVRRIWNALQRRLH